KKRGHSPFPEETWNAFMERPELARHIRALPPLRRAEIALEILDARAYVADYFLGKLKGIQSAAESASAEAERRAKRVAEELLVRTYAGLSPRQLETAKELAEAREGGPFTYSLYQEANKLLGFTLADIDRFEPAARAMAFGVLSVADPSL